MSDTAHNNGPMVAPLPLSDEITRLRADLAAANERAAKYQSLAAELSDKLNGTPCAEIRWQQERDAYNALISDLRLGIAVLGDVTKHLGLQSGQDRAAQMLARIDAALAKEDE